MNGRTNPRVTSITRLQRCGSIKEAAADILPTTNTVPKRFWVAFYALDADRRFSDGPPTFRRVAMSRSSSEAEFEMLPTGDLLLGLRRVIAGPPKLSNVGPG